MRSTQKYFVYALFASLFLAPAFALAAGPSTFEVTGWIPYWRTATGTADVLPHLNEVTEVDPFVYTLKSDGTIVDNGQLDQEPWVSFIAQAKSQHVRVIPTIMSGSGDLLHSLLSNARSRRALEDSIANLVKTNNFDGIDIDFEGKKAEDKDYFSTFLKGLYQRLGNKFLMCTIESRTPVSDRYYGTEVPPDAEIYANDLVQINKYCDRVRIMTYDQQNIDQKLAAQAASSSQLYAPVADPAWVEKVVNFMAKDISRSKMLIGVPTYGYEYDVTAYANNQYVYDIMWTFNPGYATQISQQYGVVPQRNAAGEMYLSYMPKVATSSLPLSSNAAANVAALAATAYADQNNSHIDFRLIDWPDAQSIADKVALAKRLGVRGVSIFKWDGGEDPGLWQAIAGAASTPVSTPSTGRTGSGTGTTGVANALSRVLAVGSRGNDVLALQRVLNASPDTQVARSGAGSPGNESTYFGPATLVAVKKFQVKYGISRPGQIGYGSVGPKTRAKVNDLLSNL